jgi:hypothetical protein
MNNLENSNNDKNAVKPFFALEEGFNNLTSKQDSQMHDFGY